MTEHTDSYIRSARQLRRQSNLVPDFTLSIAIGQTRNEFKRVGGRKQKKTLDFI